MADKNVRDEKAFKRLQLAEEGQGKEASAFNSDSAMQTQAVGTSGTEIYGGYFDEEYLDKLKNRDAAYEYDKMRRSEPQVAMLLSATVNPIKSAQWELEPAIAGDTDSELQAELMREILFNGIDFEQFKHEALTLVPFGYSLFEAVHSVVLDHPKFGAFNGLKALAFRSQKTVQSWGLERLTGKLLWVEQMGQGDVSIPTKIPGQFLIVITNQKEGDNYEGISALRPCYGPYVRKLMYQKLTAIGVEKHAFGVPVVTVPATKEKTADFIEMKKVLKSYMAHEQGFITIPEGWKLEMSKSEFNAGAMVELIKLENTEMVNAFLANFLALGTNGAGGAFALSSDLSDFFLSCIQAYANLIAQAINRKLIPDLCKLNFGSLPAYPTLKVTGISDKAGAELATILGTFADKKYITPDMPLEEFLRKQFGLTKADPTTARKVEPAPAPFGNPQLTEVQLGGPGSGPQGGEGYKGARVVKKADGWHALSKDGAHMGPFKDEAHLKAHIDKFYSAQLSEGAAIPKPVNTPYVSMLERGKAEAKLFMQNSLREMADDLKLQLRNQYDAARTEGAKIATATRVEIKPELIENHKLQLQNIFGKYAAMALRQARIESAKLQLSETVLKLAAPTAPVGSGFYAALPPLVQKAVTTQATLLSTSQPADIAKIVTFQFTSSNTGTDDIDQIERDIDEAVEKTVAGDNSRGMSVDAAAGDAIASVSSQAQLSYFFDPEVLDEIESFTFENNDPVSACCQELEGTTWEVGDSQIDEFNPPLHHNCKSRMKANLKGVPDNPQVNGPVSISEEAKKAITL